MILITAPTGRIGGQVLEEIRDSAEPIPQSTATTSFRQWCMDVLKPAAVA
jgi:hypothetical protein